MANLEEQVETEFAEFGALTAEQQALVNAFAKMVRKGQVPIPNQAPRDNEGGPSNGDGANVDSTQLDDLGDPNEEAMETGSLRISAQHGIRARDGAEETVRRVTKVNSSGVAGGLS